MNNKQYKEEVISFRELGERLGITDLDTPEIYDIRDEGYEILSFDHETNQQTWKPLNAFVVKKNAEEHYQVNTLHGTKDHRIWVDGQYVRLEDYVGAELVREPIQVVDCEVADTHNYLAEGQINHNTTTPGGMAIPYAASVRIRIGAGKQVEEKNRVIGINVTAKTIKNKVASPFREANFEIHFGKGVREAEQVFDLMRTYCSTSKQGVAFDDKLLMVEGTSAWKTFTITDAASGETIEEVKFYKSEFGDKVLYNPKYENEMAAIFDAALIVTGTDVSNHFTYGGVSETVSAKNDTKENKEEEESN